MEIISNSYLSPSLILQTVQQLIAVYGGDVDKIVKGNTNNIIFIKSNDITMIDEMVSLAGKTHNTHTTSATQTVDKKARVKQTDGKLSVTRSVAEEDVIPRNQFLQLKRQESIVLRANNNPIYNQGQTMLPMSYQLFSTFRPTINIPGEKYSLQTVPTMSSALEFDPKRNMPNFYAMVEKRVAQARLVKQMEEQYRDAYGYSQIDIDRMDQNTYAREIMDAVNDKLREIHKDELERAEAEAAAADYLPTDEHIYAQKAIEREKDGSLSVNAEYFEKQIEAEKQLVPDYDKRIFAGDQISRSMLVNQHGTKAISGSFISEMVIQAVVATKGQFMADSNFRWDDEKKELTDNKGNVLMRYEKNIMDTISDGIEDGDSRIYGEHKPDNADVLGYTVSDRFLIDLAKRNSWESIAGGSFELKMAQLMRERDEAFMSSAEDEEVFIAQLHEDDDTEF